MDKSEKKPTNKAIKSQGKKKPVVNAHTFYECYGGTGRTSSAALEQIRAYLAKWKGAHYDPEKQSEQQKDK